MVLAWASSVFPVSRAMLLARAGGAAAGIPLASAGGFVSGVSCAVFSAGGFVSNVSCAMSTAGWFVFSIDCAVFSAGCAVSGDGFTVSCVGCAVSGDGGPVVASTSAGSVRRGTPSQMFVLPPAGWTGRFWQRGNRNGPLIRRPKILQ